MKEGICLSDYIGKEIICQCGRIHKTAVRRIEIGSKALNCLPEIIRESNYHKACIIADKHTWAAAGEAVARLLLTQGIPFSKIVFEDDELVPDESAVEKILKNRPNDCDLVIGVGSGTINDLCKYTSAQCMDMIIVATAPSMDGFASTGAAMIVNHMKQTFEVDAPVAIIGDTDILSAAPMEMIAAGIGDTIGKYTCLLDWKLSHIINHEYYCNEVVEMVEQALESVVTQRKEIALRDANAIQSVMEALVLTGVAMGFVGNSRPASGCEHHISHFWEMNYIMKKKKPLLHGVQVGVGTILTIRMYQRLIREKIDFKGAMNAEFDRTEWEARMEKCYGEAFDGIVTLEEKCGKNDIQKRNDRLLQIQEKWNLIRQTIWESIPSEETVKDLLRSVDSPVTPEQAGIEKQDVYNAIIAAKEVRDRYTLLQLLWDVGLQEQYAEWIAC